jgi:hypothetical protein
MYYGVSKSRPFFGTFVLVSFLLNIVILNPLLKKSMHAFGLHCLPVFKRTRADSEARGQRVSILELELEA